MGQNFIKGNTKRCNGPLHQGEYIPLTEFWFHKSGVREGKPFSQCADCLNFRRWGDTEHGLVPYKDVRFIFQELVHRIGKAEAARRIGMSPNFYCRHKLGTYSNVRKGLVVKAMIELKKCRETQEARHRKSVRHGSTERGRTERIPTRMNEFNGVNNKSKEDKRNFRKEIQKEARLTA